MESLDVRNGQSWALIVTAQPMMKRKNAAVVILNCLTIAVFGGKDWDGYFLNDGYVLRTKTN